MSDHIAGRVQDRVLKAAYEGLRAAASQRVLVQTSRDIQDPLLNTVLSVGIDDSSEVMKELVEAVDEAQ